MTLETTTTEFMVNNEPAGVVVNPRREWTEADEAKFIEFVKKEGYDSFKLKIERMICEFNEDLIGQKDLDMIPRMESLTTLLRLCDNARA